MIFRNFCVAFLGKLFQGDRWCGYVSHTLTIEPKTNENHANSKRQSADHRDGEA